MKVLGVDPGGKGALALVGADGALIDVIDMPVLMVRRGKTDKPQPHIHALADLLTAWDPTVTYFEQTGGMQGDSPSAAYNFGRMAGAAEAVARTLGGKFVFVTPTVWKKAVGLIHAGKDGARAKAIDWFPGHAARFQRKSDDGRAEAALLAEYGRQRELVGLGLHAAGRGVFD